MRDDVPAIALGMGGDVDRAPSDKIDATAIQSALREFFLAAGLPVPRRTKLAQCAFLWTRLNAMCRDGR